MKPWNKHSIQQFFWISIFSATKTNEKEWSVMFERWNPQLWNSANLSFYFVLIAEKIEIQNWDSSHSLSICGFAGDNKRVWKFEFSKWVKVLLLTCEAMEEITHTWSLWFFIEPSCKIIFWNYSEFKEVKNSTSSAQRIPNTVV